MADEYNDSAGDNRIAETYSSNKNNKLDFPLKTLKDFGCTFNGM